MLSNLDLESNNCAKNKKELKKLFAMFGLVNYPLFFILENIFLM
jgi:hypothetical protein